MTTQTSEFLTGITYDDTANTATIDLTIEPWLTIFSGVAALSPTNSEQYDAALLLGLEQACNGLDTNLDSPIGRGEVPFDGVESAYISRANADGSVTETQIRKQIYIACYFKDAALSPINAVNNDD